jgi:hypothetical protein
VARNLSWIDKRKLNALLEEDEEKTEAPEPERPAALLDEDPPSRFNVQRSRFDEAPREPIPSTSALRSPPPRPLGEGDELPRFPDAPTDAGAPMGGGLLDDVPAPPLLDGDAPAPPPFPEPEGWRPAELEPPAPPPLGGALPPDLPADEGGSLQLPSDENVLDETSKPDLEGVVEALDRLPLEAFATSGASSFDLPPAPDAASIVAPEPEVEEPASAAPVVDDAAQFNPWDLTPTTDHGSMQPIQDDDEGPDLDNPEDAIAAAFGTEPPPPIEDVTLPAVDEPPREPPPPIEDISLPTMDLFDAVVRDEDEPPTTDLPPPEGFMPGSESHTAYTLDIQEPTATGETGSYDDDDLGFIPPFAADPEPEPAQQPAPAGPPPPIADEAIELTCERFFDWALDHSGLDGAVVVDGDGLPIAERGFHELHPAFLIEALPLASGLSRYHGAPQRGCLKLTHGRLHVVIVWSTGERAFVVGLSGLAAPQNLTGLDDAFDALFGGARSPGGVA